jgi:hypothetical protein
MINYITIDGRTIVSELEDDKASDEAALLDFFRTEDKIPLSKLAKYYLNENLNFLCGSGTSVSIGGKTINKDENPFETILKELRSVAKPKEYIGQLIKFFESDDLLEKKFDKINQEHLYYLNNKDDAESAKTIKEYLDKALKIFVEKKALKEDFFFELATVLDENNQPVFKYNINDKRFWNSPAWKRMFE